MLSIASISVTPFEQNATVLIDTQANVAVLVDPGGDASQLLQAVPPNITLSAIWITHSHIDHVGGVADVLAACGASIPVVAHPDDAINRSYLPEQARRCGLPLCPPFNVTTHVQDGDQLWVGDYPWVVLHTPGHAQGHLSFFHASSQTPYKTPVLIAGDTLFKGSIGRTDLPGGDTNELMGSIRQKLLTCPSQTTVLPGHGPSTTIDHESQTNPFLRA